MRLDSTLALGLAGYDFGRRRFERAGTDVFETRLLLQPTTVMRGREAAEVFYDTERFHRRTAFPLRVQRTLLGVGAVMALDGDAHRRRKALFLSLMSPEEVQRLAELVTQEWRDRLPAWQRAGTVVLYDEVARILCRAVHAWAGVPVADQQVAGRTDDLHALIESGAAVGPRHWRGLHARGRAERGLAELVERVRRGELAAPPGSALDRFTTFRDADGEPLDARVVAVELLNVLRPTVAIDRFVTFVALALHDHPDWRDRVRAGDEEAAGWFVHEVRRFYPFFPMTAARASRPFDWHGVHFPAGRRAMLDLYGTDHDPATWSEPDVFRPERFREWDGDPFSLVPQGGGNHSENHRCAGEWVTLAVMHAALRMLSREMEYDVPDQDLRVNHRLIPTLPASGFVVANVRPGG